MLYTTISFSYQTWSSILSNIGSCYFNWYSNYNYYYQFISYLSILDIIASESSFVDSLFNCKAFENDLLIGSIVQFSHTDPWWNSFTTLKSKTRMDTLSDLLSLNNDLLIYTCYNFFFSQNIIIDLEFNSTYFVTNAKDISSHYLIDSNRYNIVDDFKYYGLEDYSVRLDYFNDLNAVQFFSLRYGFGSVLSEFVCKSLGISMNISINKLFNYWHYSKGESFFEHYSIKLDNSLSETVLENHRKLIKLNSRKGIRLLNGFPIYGQRTRSNAKTSCKFPYKYQFRDQLVTI